MDGLEFEENLGTLLCRTSTGPRVSLNYFKHRASAGP